VGDTGAWEKCSFKLIVTKCSFCTIVMKCSFVAVAGRAVKIAYTYISNT